MPSRSSALALALGAGSGLALWYLFRDDPKRPSGTPARSVGTTSGAGATGPAAQATAPAPCRLQLTAAGLTSDGQPTDIPSAVARCKAAGRADVSVSGDAPGAVYAQLAAGLVEAGVAVTPLRNGRASSRPVKHRPPSPRPVELADFAATVAALAHGIDADPTPKGRARGRFGERKVFIAAIRRRLAETEYGRLPRATVDELLVESMRQGLLELARADLVAAMDPDEVQDSEVRYLNATFHFVISKRPDASHSSARKP